MRFDRVRLVRKRVPESKRFPNLSSAAWRHMRLYEPELARRVLARSAVRLGQIGVLNGLSQLKQVELAALVVLLSHLYNERLGDAYVYRQLHRARKEIGPRGRKLRAKIDRVAKAMDEVADYLADIEQPFMGDFVRGIMAEPGTPGEIVPDAASWRAQAAACRAIRVGTPADVARYTDEILPGHPGPAKRPAIDREVTARLTQFFIEVCHVSRAEADIRTAKIGNALWDWSVPILTKGGGTGPSRGSQTVRSRRRRASRN